MVPLRLTRQDGVSLVELVGAMAAGILVLGVIMTFSVTSFHNEATTRNRANRLEEMETALERMTHEIRQAGVVAYGAAGQASIALTMPTGTVVSWDCSTGTCLRRVGGSVTMRPLGSIASSAVYTLECRVPAGQTVGAAHEGDLVTSCTGNPYRYVAVRLVSRLDCSGEGDAASCPSKTLEVDGGAQLRNS